MKKGGYKIIDFKGTALSGTAVEISEIYNQIVDEYDKPIMVSGVSLNGDIMDDAYAGVQEKTGAGTSKSVELTVYGGVITVTDDDEVTFVVSKTNAELIVEIGDLDDLETTAKDSLVDAINELNKHESFSLDSGNKLILERNGKNINIYTTGYCDVTILTNIIPVGYRPSNMITAPFGYYNNTYTTQRGEILTDGTIRVLSASGTTESTGSTVFNISYSI